MVALKRIGETALKLTDWLAEWSGVALAPLALLYMMIIIYEIVLRYAFNNPTIWAHETATMLFGTQFMLAGAYSFRQGAMVNVGLLHDRLSLRVRAAVDLVTFLFPLAICISLFWFGGEFFLDSVKQNEVSPTFFGPPLYPLRGIIPLAALLLLIQVIAKFTRDVHIVITGRRYNG